MAGKMKSKEKKVENQDQCRRIDGGLKDLKKKTYPSPSLPRNNQHWQWFHVVNKTPFFCFSEMSHISKIFKAHVLKSAAEKIRGASKTYPPRGVLNTYL